MANYNLIIPLAVRELEIKIFGTAIRVTEKLYKDPAPIQQARAKLFEGKSAIDDLISRRKNKEAEPLSEDEEILAMQNLANQLEIAIASDERMQVCERFSQSIIETDLVDDDGASMPLSAQPLYDSKVPTEMLESILDEVAKVPLVPKAK